MHIAYCPWNNSMVVKPKTDKFTFFPRPTSKSRVPNKGYVDEYIVFMLFFFNNFIFHTYYSYLLISLKIMFFLRPLPFYFKKNSRHAYVLDGRRLLT